VPYTIHTTGIAWRTDKVKDDVAKLPNPYDALWDEQYRGKVGILDDYREAIGMTLLKNGITDLNTGDQNQLNLARDQLVALAKAVRPRVNTNDYIDLPEAKTWITHAWSGDMVNAQYYMPKGQSADVTRYWFPADGKGPVNSDLIVLLRSGKNPVLGHLFLDHLLDYDVAVENMSWNGYQPPLNKLDPGQAGQPGAAPGQPQDRDRAARLLRLRLPLPGAAGRGRRPLARGLAGVQGRGLSLVATSQRGPAGAWRPRWFWPAFAAPGMAWLVVPFLLPFYVVLAIAFGAVDPLFRTPVPVWNPVAWNPFQFQLLFDRVFGAGGFLGPAFVRTFVYVAVASGLWLLLAYPVAYYVTRHAGRRKGVLLVALLAPFWVSYMMRRLAWVNLLESDGMVNRLLVGVGVLREPFPWLAGQPVSVTLGLVYGYVPYMVLALYAGLDRVDQRLLEAARDLGASRRRTFALVTLPLSRQAILAGLVVTALPMFGDHFTNDLLSGSPRTSMPMLGYVRSTGQASREAGR
jgi:ABC-type spermidine/putrescine transport system permease subunit I